MPGSNEGEMSRRSLLFRRMANIAGSLVVPFALEAWMIHASRAQPALFGGETPLVCAVAGFVFLAYECRVYSLLIAIANFPLMLQLLFRFGFLFLNDWP